MIIYTGYLQKSSRHNYWIQTSSEDLHRVRSLMHNFLYDAIAKYPGNAWKAIILQSNSDEKREAEYSCNHEFGDHLLEIVK